MAKRNKEKSFLNTNRKELIFNNNSKDTSYKQKVKNNENNNLSASDKIKNKTKKELEIKKEKLIENSKLRKKIKTTQKKIELDNKNLINSIMAIKLSTKQKELIEFEDIYLYIFLKNSIDKKLDNENLKKLKSKLIKLPVGIINEINNLKVCLVDDNLLNKKDEKLYFDEILDNLKLKEKDEGYMDILSNEEFFEKFKSKDLNLNNEFTNIIVSEKSRSRINQILKSKNDINSDLVCKNIIYYSKEKYGRRIFEYLKKIIENSLTCSVLNTYTKYNLGYLKLANTSMSNKEIFKNVKIMLIKTMSILLSVSEKYTTSKCVILKSSTSMPFEIFGKMSHEELSYFENN
jgi:hypothetical protein